jgi:hypothetical protein
MKIKERIEISKQICQLYATDQFTIESCCKKYGVSYDAFYTWISDSQPEYSQECKDLYKKAQQTKRKANNKTLVKLARTALQKKLDMIEYDEVHTTEDLKGTTVKTITKKIIPNAADIALALNNLDSDFDRDKDPIEDETELFEKLKEVL